MKSKIELPKTYILFKTSKFFDTNPDYDCDQTKVPPPGKELASALIEYFKTQGIEFKYNKIPSEFWEHSNWFFDGKWQNVEYGFTIQSNCSFSPPLAFFVGVSKKQGILKSLFCDNGGTCEIDKELLKIIESAILKLCEPTNLEWVNANIAPFKVWEI